MGLLRDLQTEIGNRLRADAVFAEAPSVEVYEEDRHDIDAEVLRATGKVGAAVAVTTPALRPAEDLPELVEATVIVEITENVLVNRGPAGSKKSWLTIGEAIYALLVDWSPPGGWSAMRFASLEQVAPGRPIIANITLTTTALLRT